MNRDELREFHLHLKFHCRTDRSYYSMWNEREVRFKFTWMDLNGFEWIFSHSLRNNHESLSIKTKQFEPFCANGKYLKVERRVQERNAKFQNFL